MPKHTAAEQKRMKAKAKANKKSKPKKRGK